MKFDVVVVLCFVFFRPVNLKWVNFILKHILDTRLLEAGPESKAVRHQQKCRSNLLVINWTFVKSWLRSDCFWIKMKIKLAVRNGIGSALRGSATSLLHGPENSQMKGGVLWYSPGTRCNLLQRCVGVMSLLFSSIFLPIHREQLYWSLRLTLLSLSLHKDGC